MLDTSISACVSIRICRLTCCVAWQNKAASCPTPPAACSLQANLYDTAANPHQLIGAVVEFASYSDDYKVWPSPLPHCAAPSAAWPFPAAIDVPFAQLHRSQLQHPSSRACLASIMLYSPGVAWVPCAAVT